MKKFREQIGGYIFLLILFGMPVYVPLLMIGYSYMMHGEPMYGWNTGQ